MQRTLNAQQMAITATAARPCAIDGHGYGAATVGSWSKQALNELTFGTARRLRKQPT